MIAMERGKRHCLCYHSNSCKDDKILHQNHECFTFELLLIKLNWWIGTKGKKKCCKLKKVHFENYIFKKSFPYLLLVAAALVSGVPLDL